MNMTACQDLCFCLYFMLSSDWCVFYFLYSCIGNHVICFTCAPVSGYLNPCPAGCSLPRCLSLVLCLFRSDCYSRPWISPECWLVLTITGFGLILTPRSAKGLTPNPSDPTPNILLWWTMDQTDDPLVYTYTVGTFQYFVVLDGSFWVTWRLGIRSRVTVLKDVTPLTLFDGFFPSALPFATCSNQRFVLQ